MRAPAGWPPPHGEKIGEELARQLVAWMREVSPPVIEEARQLLAEVAPGVPVVTSSCSVQALAGWGLDEGMSALCVGTVWCTAGKAVWMMMDILLTREGELVARPGYGMR